MGPITPHCPRPRGGESKPLLYVELLNRGAPEQNICRNAPIGAGKVSQSEFKQSIYENCAGISE